MPKRGKGVSDDTSPGDARKPYSDIGGPDDRHARTHDVRREQLTNPRGPGRGDDEFAADLAPQTPTTDLRGHADAAVPASEDKRLQARLPELTADELQRLTVVAAGEQLGQGAVYLDLNDRAGGPFKALGGQVAGAGHRFVAKKDVDYELWNRLVGDDREAAVVRPSGDEQAAQQAG